MARRDKGSNPADGSSNTTNRGSPEGERGGDDGGHEKAKRERSDWLFELVCSSAKEVPVKRPQSPVQQPPTNYFRHPIKDQQCPSLRPSPRSRTFIYSFTTHPPYRKRLIASITLVINTTKALPTRAMATQSLRFWPPLRFLAIELRFSNKRTSRNNSSMTLS